MTSNWYDDWTYEEVILPAGRNRTHSWGESSLGYMHLYVDPVTQIKHRLWMYTGKLAIQNDVEKLLDVAERGDGLARGRALVALADIAPDNAGYLHILYAWVAAQDYSDTIEVSKSVLYSKDDFKVAKRLAHLAVNKLTAPKDRTPEIERLVGTKPKTEPRKSGKPVEPKTREDDFLSPAKPSTTRKRPKTKMPKLTKPSEKTSDNKPEISQAKRLKLPRIKR